MSGQFAQLLEQLSAETEANQTLAKALPQDNGQDDNNIQAAAEEGSEGSTEGEEGAEGGEGEGNGDGEGGDLTKSLTLEDGEEVIDATEMIKSLQETQTEHAEILAKAMPQFIELLQGQRAMIQQQGDLIKSMQTRLDQFAGQGRGRKAVVTIVDKPNPGETPMNKSLEQPQFTSGQILAKSLELQKAGKLTGLDVSRCENAIQAGVAIPADILAKIQ